VSTTPCLPFSRRQNLVELGADLESRGLLENSPTYYERFREAFVTEVNEFVACCLDDTGQSASHSNRARHDRSHVLISFSSDVILCSRPRLAGRRRPGGQDRRCVDSRVQDRETGLVRRGWGGDLRMIVIQL
jgi:hypothetical protein